MPIIIKKKKKKYSRLILISETNSSPIANTVCDLRRQ